LKGGGFTVGMRAAVLRRTGLVSVLAAGAVMLGSSLYGMTRVDHALELAAAAPPARPGYVLDVPAEPRYERHRQLVRDCEKPREHHPRI
jgi:hypothetical protein